MEKESQIENIKQESLTSEELSELLMELTEGWQ